VFAFIQSLGVASYIGAIRFAFDSAHEHIGDALSFAYHYFLQPGNLIGGALLSTFHLWFRYWYIEFLLGAVVLNAGFWLLCAAASRAVREHMSGVKPHRYAIAFLGTTAAFVALNVLYYHTQPVTCADCFFERGVPFHLYHEGGFAGGEAIMWEGLAADFLMVLAIATLLGSAWKWRSGKRAV
jgi:hypothetical protein